MSTTDYRAMDVPPAAAAIVSTMSGSHLYTMAIEASSRRRHYKQTKGTRLHALPSRHLIIHAIMHLAFLLCVLDLATHLFPIVEHFAGAIAPLGASFAAFFTAIKDYLTDA